MALGTPLFEQLGDLLVLLFYAAVIYQAVSYARVRGGRWPKVLGWSALVAFVVQAVLMAARVSQDSLRSSTPSRETPDVPVSYETWELMGTVGSLLGGMALLICGVALVFVGWLEGQGGTSGKSERKKAKRT